MRSRQHSWALPKSVSVVIHPREGRCKLQIHPSQLVVNGVCDEKNAVYTAFCIGAYVTLLDDSPFGYAKKPKKTYLAFLRHLTETSIRGVILRMASLADKCMTAPVVYGSDENWDEILTLSKDLPIFKEILYFTRTQSTVHYQYILTFLRFLKKMRYIDPELIPSALRKWNIVEDRLRELVIDETSPLIRLMKSFVHLFCTDVGISLEECRFGPGHVAEGIIPYDPSNKLAHLKFWGNAARVVQGTCLRSKNPCRTSLEYLTFLTMKGVPELVSEAKPWARIKFVDKDIGTYRTICMEPNGHMFLQQGLLRSIERVIRLNMRRFVTLKDQLGNQVAAQFGSATGLVDTIDLSSASDSVSEALIRAIFPRNWKYYLFGTRTDVVKLPDGELRIVNKFAPMGSAVCFPVQCIVFTAMSLASIALTESRLHDDPMNYVDDVCGNPQDFIDRSILRSHSTSGYRNEGVYFPLTVYGDDIIIDARATPELMRNLTVLGFEPNHSKSFQGGQAVRESCGEYFLRGSNVTPLTLKVKWFDKDLTGSAYASLVGLANLSEMRGYLNLRSFVISYLKDVTGGKRQFKVAFTTNDDSFGILSRNLLLERSAMRWNPDYQREELSMHVVSTQMVKTHEGYADMYFYHLHQQRDVSLEDGEPVEAHSRMRADSLRIRPRWTPVG